MASLWDALRRRSSGSTGTFIGLDAEGRAMYDTSRPAPPPKMIPTAIIPIAGLGGREMPGLPPSVGSPAIQINPRTPLGMGATVPIEERKTTTPTVAPPAPRIRYPEQYRPVDVLPPGYVGERRPGHFVPVAPRIETKGADAPMGPQLAATSGKVPGWMIPAFLAFVALDYAKRAR